MSQQVANHAPLIFAMPQASKASSSSLRTSKLVEFVDIFPTLVEATGFQPLDICPMMSNTSVLCTEGASLMPLLDDPELAQWKSSVFWQYPRREIFIKTQSFANIKCSQISRHLYVILSQGRLFSRQPCTESHGLLHSYFGVEVVTC